MSLLTQAYLLEKYGPRLNNESNARGNRLLVANR